MRQKIYFRADAGAEIGYGHFIRTLALADMLKDDFDCTFFTCEPTSYQVKEVEKVCRLVTLPGAVHFDLFLSYLNGDEIVVLDNYFFNNEYHRKIRNKCCRLVCIDDIHDRYYHADAVINQMVTDPSVFKTDRYTRLCLGREWALLRKPFLEPVAEEKREAGHWFISFGGSDIYNLTEKYVRLAERRNALKISVVVGDRYAHSSKLSEYWKAEVYRNLSADAMSDLIERCEYAVVPCSGICLEALSRGCKVISGYYVENQKEAYRCLKEEKLISPIGNMLTQTSLEGTDGTTEPMRVDFSQNKFRYISLFTVLSADYTSGTISLVDYVRLPQSLQRAVLDARNEESVRTMMDSPEEISWENHCRFVAGLIGDTEHRYWAVFDKDVLVGSVNVHYLDTEKVERGIYVIPSESGKSYGSRIESVTDKLFRSIGVKEVVAKVLHTNERSLHFHYKNGYRKYNDDSRYEYLVKKI